MKLYQYVSSYTYIRLLTSCSKSWRGHLSLHVGGVPVCQYLLCIFVYFLTIYQEISAQL